jgi:hypothetical protein
MVNWKNLEQKISNVKLSNQHMTTSTKLDIAKYHLQRLASMVPSRKITDLIRVSYDEKTNQMKIWAFDPTPVFAFLAEFEAFLFSLRSSVDSFLLEVNLICKLKIPDEKVSLSRVKDEMVSQRGRDGDLTKHLLSLYEHDNKGKWFRYLGELRNLITHRICSSIITSVDYRLYLPDKPEVEPFSIKEDIEFFAKLNELLKETQSFLDEGFGYLQDQL